MANASFNRTDANGPLDGQGQTAMSAAPIIRGKFLFAGEDKLWIKGVTYGTFRPRADGELFPEKPVVESDFRAMAKHGVNTVRTYTPPPIEILDIAMHCGLRVLVGISWTQHVAFLEDRALCRSIRRDVLASVTGCADHPAVLGFSIGNEIPASIVRWHGRRKIQRFLRELYSIVKSVRPESLVTYVNYPTTEYLDLGFLDFISFNVYVEDREKMESYLMRLQNLADEKPLVLAEIGLDSRRHGQVEQSKSIEWQLRTAYASGCAGAIVFSWTDEWFRGGHDIEDWDFGLTTRDREPKPALATVSDVFSGVPFPNGVDWPRISVVVCSFNGAATIRDTLDGLSRLAYSDYEVIVIDDGSTDDTAKIASEYDCRIISTENRGLSSARNTGYEAGDGEIIAYIDDDAHPDPHWLTYLAHGFLNTDHAGVGGPNLAPPGDGWIADCVANSPGGPVHVLLSDSDAEHIPGCNMAFRREALVEVGGFDPVFRTAGDDVDLCWRLQQAGHTIGFSAAAVVWHHRRNSLSMYWRQQQGYGTAEALLERKWPEKYNALGHLNWSGRLYGKGLTRSVDSRRWRVYSGTFGLAPFQSLYERNSSGLWSLPLMPEWFLLLAGLLVLGLLGFLWPPLKVFWALSAIAAALPVTQAVMSAAKAAFTGNTESLANQSRLYGVTAGLHLLQPVARLIGRIRHGLVPWRDRVSSAGQRGALRKTAWLEYRQEPQEVLSGMLDKLRASGIAARSGCDFDDWDVEVPAGMPGSARLLVGVEEHGGGKQLLRFRIRRKFSAPIVGLLAVQSAIALGAAIDGAWAVFMIAMASAVVTFVWSRLRLGSAAAAINAEVRSIGASNQRQ